MPRALAGWSAALVAVVAALALGAASSPAVTAARAAAARQTAAPALRVRLIGAGGDRVRVRVWSTTGTLRDVRLTVTRQSTVLATGRLATATPRRRTVVLTVRRGYSSRGPLQVSGTAVRGRG